MPPLRVQEMMRELIQQTAKASLGTEIIYSFLVISISLMIYIGTRELYNLTNHKGIKYFRLAFLCFAIAFFFRSFIKFLLVSLNLERILGLNVPALATFSLLIFMFSSSMAVFYLLYSVMWKKWNESKIIVFYILAAMIAIITLIIRSYGLILLIHVILFVFLAIVTLISYKESKRKRKGHHLHGVYILLFAFWILNIIDLVITNALGTFQLVIYLASLSIFLAILYKVLRRLGA